MELSGKSVLVTGGAGLIGTHLTESLLADNDVLVADDCSKGRREWVPEAAEFVEADLTDPDDVAEVVTADLDVVFHLAALSDVNRGDHRRVFEANNRMRWFTFMTNLDVGEEEARALREYYHYRWAIESAFSDYKQNFLPTTKSTNLGMRTYLYLFGMTTYNAWVAANTKARRQHLEDSERKRPPIRASRFTTLGQQRYRTDEFLTESINFEVD